MASLHQANVDPMTDSPRLPEYVATGWSVQRWKLIAMKGNLRTLFRRFCLDGSVLGLKYLYLFPDKCSRFFWLVWVLFILQFGGVITYALYLRFVALPTRITIENQFEPVESLPFPAITLCTPNQMTISGVKHFDETLVNGNRSSDMTSILQQLLGFFYFVKMDINDLAHLQKLIELNRYTVPEVLMLLPQSCSRFLRMCFFRQRPYPHCRGLFRPLLTQHGLCCVFNSIYYYKTNRRNERDFSFKPHLVENPGVMTGLTVITDYDPDDAVNHTIQFAGATRLMFTDWTEFPADDESLLLSPATESFHLIKATTTYCSNDVLELPPSSRACLLESERILPYFHSYRNSDCDLLCLSHAVEAHCQCLLLYLPNLRLQQACPVSKIPCITEAKLNLGEWQDTAECECPRDCDSRRYRVDSSVGNTDALPYMFRQIFSRFQINRSSSIMHFDFPTPVYVKQKQETVMCWTTLAANLGGVFGLCLGCSVMSVLEVWFFSHAALGNCARSLRPRRRHQHWRQPYIE